MNIHTYVACIHTYIHIKSSYIYVSYVCTCHTYVRTYVRKCMCTVCDSILCVYTFDWIVPLQLLQNQLTSGLNLLSTPQMPHVSAPLLSPTSPTHASSPMNTSTGTGLASPGLPGLSNLSTGGNLSVGSSGPLSPLGSLGSLNSSVNSTMGNYSLLSEPLPGYTSE